jgi:hypothetical protein
MKEMVTMTPLDERDILVILIKTEEYVVTNKGAQAGQQQLLKLGIIGNFTKKSKSVLKEHKDKIKNRKRI